MVPRDGVEPRKESARTGSGPPGQRPPPERLHWIRFIKRRPGGAGPGRGLGSHLKSSKDRSETLLWSSFFRG